MSKDNKSLNDSKKITPSNDQLGENASGESSSQSYSNSSSSKDKSKSK